MTFKEFRYWLGSPQGALVYFSTTWGLVLLWFWWETAQ